jgi:hypothetical protein
LDEKTIKKEKGVGRNRAKIFKEELIDSIPLQNKTSLHCWSYGEGTTSSRLVIGNWNVNGIRSVISKKMIYPYLHSNKPDILCITETKVDGKNFEAAPISLSGYHSYWNFPKHASGYSGVAVFSKFLPKSATEDML